MTDGKCGISPNGCVINSSNFVTSGSGLGYCPLTSIERSDPSGTNCYINGASSYPAPTMYLGATNNDLTYQLVLSSGKIANITVTNIPIQRWVHSVLCVYDQTAEIYIDGKLAKTVAMGDIMYDIASDRDIILSPNDTTRMSSTSSLVGFSGYTSSLTYYPNPITPQDVWNLYIKGPGTTGLPNSNSAYSLQVSLFDGNVQKNSLTIGGNKLISYN